MWLRTVKTGQRAAVWDTRGQVRFIDGPKRVWVFRRTFELLPSFTAEPHQYLVITLRNGQRQHIRGPAMVWFDPVAHELITVEEAININAHEAVVVYVQDAGQVQRRIIRGPELHVPAENEWMHTFRWHGSDPNHPTRKIPRALEFTKLRTIPDQMYCDVEDVRTADDALVVVKLMLFFELHDLEQMLDQTHDPVADLMNAVSADVIAFVSARRFETFKEQAKTLNELTIYQQLRQRGARIGYRITKVVFRGYVANQKLQAMHDNAIETRTQLQLESETELQAQELADVKLTREAQRAEQQRTLEEAAVKHQQDMTRLAHDETLRQRQHEHTVALEGEQRQEAARLEQHQARQAVDAEFFKLLRGMQVDLTQYLVAQEDTAEKVVRIDTMRPPHLHVHEGATHNGD